MSTAIVKFGASSYYLPYEKQQNNSGRTRLRQIWKNVFWVKGLGTKMVGNLLSIRQTNVHYIFTYATVTGIEV